MWRKRCHSRRNNCILERTEVKAFKKGRRLQLTIWFMTSSVTFTQLVVILGTRHLLMLLHRILWSWMSVHLSGHFRPLYVSPDELYGDAGLIFHLNLIPSHAVKGTNTWFNHHVVQTGKTCLILRSSIVWCSCQNEKERHHTQQCLHCWVWLMANGGYLSILSYLNICINAVIYAQSYLTALHNLLLCTCT